MGGVWKKLANVVGSLLTLAGGIVSAAGYPYIGIPMIVAGGALCAVTADAWEAEAKRESPAFGGHRMNVRSSRQPVKLIYGEVEVGVNKTFYHLSNPYLHIICEIGEGTLSGIKREDGSIYSTTATALPSSNPPLVYMDEELWTTYGGNVYMEWFDGASDQAICSTLQTVSAGLWDQTLPYTSYLYVRLKFDMDYFKQEPTITIVMRGLEVLDPIASTTDWSDNPVLHAYDLITRPSQRGGLGVVSTKMDLTSLETARDYCTAKGWKCNYPIGEQRPVADNLDQITGTYRGTIIYSDGKFKFRFMDYNYESVQMALTESDIIAGSLQVAMPDISERYNAIRITYLDALKNYKANDFVLSSEADVTADGDYRELAMTLYGLSDINLVQKMANYFLERNRLRKIITFVAGERTKLLEPNDLITLTHSMPGWTANLMRVQSATINPDETVTLSCVDESPTLYDDIYNIGNTDYFNTNLLNPNTPPPEVTGVTITETVYEFRLRSQSRIDVTFTAPADYPWLEHVEVWVSQDNATWTHQFNTKSSFSIDPVEEGVTYYIKLITVNIFGTRDDFDSAPIFSKLIDGKSDSIPSSLSSLTAIITGTALNLYADRLTTESDIELYEFRMGASWSGGIFLSAVRAPNLSLNGVKPGAHTIWANTLGTNGLYGDTPRSVSVVVPDPPRGWTVASTFEGTTAGACFDSTVYLYNSSNYIKVNHSSALTGSWESTIFDTSTAKEYLAYITSDYTVIGTGSLWSDIFPTTATKWSDVFTVSKTWADAFAPEQAPQIRMKLNYGNTTALGSTIERLEILSGLVTGRYFKSVISIIDPQPSIYGIVQLPTLKLAT
jgi:hypothetical protein